jgi:integrase
MLTLAREEELLQTVPYFPKLHEPEARQGFCDVDKFGDLYHHLPERLRTISLFLYTTGCRIGEAKKLRWDQVDWAARVIRVEGLQTKNKTARTIPLTGPVYDRLQAIPEASRAGLLFPVGCFRKAWQSACVKAGLGTLTKGSTNGGYGTYEGLQIHDFRRSAVRNLRLKGIGETVAMSVSGHKTTEVFRRYNIVVDADKTAAVNLVGADLDQVLQQTDKQRNGKVGSRMGQVNRASGARKSK